MIRSVGGKWILKATVAGFVLYSFLIIFVYEIFFAVNPVYFLQTPGRTLMITNSMEAILYIPALPGAITSLPLYIALIVTGLLSGAFWQQTTPSASDYRLVIGGGIVGFCTALGLCITGLIAGFSPFGIMEYDNNLVLDYIVTKYWVTTPASWLTKHAWSDWPFPTVGLVLFFGLPIIAAAIGASIWHTRAE
jgi:hypothetical protein